MDDKRSKNKRKMEKQKKRKRENLVIIMIFEEKILRTLSDSFHKRGE